MHAKWMMPLVVVLLAFGATAYAIYNRYPSGGTPVACSMDAKICPDGSAVGRVPPNCDFAACPAAQAPPTAPEVVAATTQATTTTDVTPQDLTTPGTTTATSSEYH